MKNCTKQLRTLQGLACHQTRMHTKNDLPYPKPPKDATRNFKGRFLNAIAAHLGATPRGGRGNPVCSGSVACDKQVFAAIFSSHPSFRYSPLLDTLTVTYLGKTGMRELEKIFGVDFWKFTFESRSYNYIQFWEQDDKKTPCRFVLKCKAEIRQNYFPIFLYSEEKISFSFRKRRDQRSATLQATAIALVIPESE